MRLTAKIIPSAKQVKELQERFPEFKPYYFEAIQALFNLANDLEKAIDLHFYNHCGKFSRARFLILLILLHCDHQRMTPHEIAKKLNVTRGNMTGLIDSLVASEYVTKTQDEADRRQVWIEMTEKARHFLRNEVFPNYFKKTAKLMSGLSREELETFTQTAIKLQKGVPTF